MAEQLQCEALQLVKRAHWDIGDRVPEYTCQMIACRSESGALDHVPSLVRECVVIQPLVRQHAAKENEPERSKRLNSIPIKGHMRLAQQFSAEAHFPYIAMAEVDGAKEDRKTDDVPQGEEHRRGLQEGRQ